MPNQGTVTPIVTPPPKAPPEDDRKIALAFATTLEHELSPYAPAEALTDIDRVAKAFCHNQLVIDAEIAQPQAERDPSTFVCPDMNYRSLPEFFTSDPLIPAATMMAKFVMWLYSKHGMRVTRGNLSSYFVDIVEDQSPEFKARRISEIMATRTFRCSVTDRAHPLERAVLTPYDGVDYGHGFDHAYENIRVHSQSRYEANTTTCHHQGCEVRVLRSSSTQDTRSGDRGYYCQNHHPRTPRHDNGHTFNGYHSTRGNTVFHDGNNPADIDFIGAEIEFFGDRITAANQVTDIDPRRRLFRCENDATCDGEIIPNPQNRTSYYASFSRDVYKLTRKLRKSGLRAWSVPEGRDYECGIHFHMNRKALKPLHIFKLFKLFYEGENLKHWYQLSGRRDFGYSYCDFRVPDDKEARRRVLRDLGKYRAPNDASYTTERSRPLNFNNEIKTIECRIMRGSFATGHINAVYEMGYALMEFVRDPAIPLTHMSFGHFVRYAAKRVRQYPHLVRMFKRRDVLGVKPFVEPPTDQPWIPDPIWWTNTVGQRIKWDDKSIKAYFEAMEVNSSAVNNTWAVTRESFNTGSGTDVMPFLLFRKRTSISSDGSFVGACYDIDTQTRRRLPHNKILPVVQSKCWQSNINPCFWILTHEWNGLAPGTLLRGWQDAEDTVELSNVEVIRVKVAGSRIGQEFMCPKLYALPLTEGSVKQVEPNDIRVDQTRFERLTLFKHVYRRRTSMAKRLRAVRAMQEHHRSH